MFLVVPSGILICCTGPFWSDSLCLFGFCLPSLLCLISTLAQAGGGDLLFRFASSVQSCYGDGAADRYRCVWGALPVFRPHWVCRVQGCLCFPRLHCSGSRMLYMERALRCVRFQFSGTPEKRGLSWACLFRAFPGRAAQAARSLTGALSPGAARLLPSTVPASVSSLAGQMRVARVYSWELASSCDPPGGCRPSRISGSLWLATGGLFAVW